MLEKKSGKNGIIELTKCPEILTKERLIIFKKSHLKKFSQHQKKKMEEVE